MFFRGFAVPGEVTRHSRDNLTPTWLKTDPTGQHPEIRAQAGKIGRETSVPAFLHCQAAILPDCKNAKPPIAEQNGTDLEPACSLVANRSSEPARAYSPNSVQNTPSVCFNGVPTIARFSLVNPASIAAPLPVSRTPTVRSGPLKNQERSGSPKCQNAKNCLHSKSARPRSTSHSLSTC